MPEGDEKTQEQLHLDMLKALDGRVRDLESTLSEVLTAHGEALNARETEITALTARVKDLEAKLSTLENVKVPDSVPKGVPGTDVVSRVENAVAAVEHLAKHIANDGSDVLARISDILNPPVSEAPQASNPV